MTMHRIVETIAKIRSRREEVLTRYAATPLFQRSLEDVKRVVVINSASRAGSSLLYALLRRLPGVIALTGEAAPFYKLNTAVNGFSIFESDKIPSQLLDSVVDYQGLSRDFLSDFSCSDAPLPMREVDVESYADRLALRLLLQWPALDLNTADLRTSALRAWDHYARQNAVFDTENFYIALLKRLRTMAPGINPYYYDINTDKVSINFPEVELPAGPPAEHFVVEEPPFILLPPGRAAGPGDVADKIVLLKSTVDCYRMNLIERIFRNADLRVIHLVRNPAATTNGLYDGWLHRGFFSHNLRPWFEGNGGGSLRIKGYSDRHPHGAYWWNFDLPDGWQDMAGRELIDVCSFQWHSANAEILDYLGSGKTPHCRVRYENIIRDLASRTAEFRKMLAFMGVPAEELEAVGMEDLPVVQSTLPPQRYRWKKRRNIIDKLLDAPHILEMSERLGYDSSKREEWL